jgi:hypothetical protein
MSNADLHIAATRPGEKKKRQVVSATVERLPLAAEEQRDKRADYKLSFVVAPRGSTDVYGRGDAIAAFCASGPRVNGRSQIVGRRGALLVPTRPSAPRNWCERARLLRRANGAHAYRGPSAQRT